MLESSPPADTQAAEQLKLEGTGSAIGDDLATVNESGPMEALMSIETSLGMWSASALEANYKELSSIGCALLAFITKWESMMIAEAGRAMKVFDAEAGKAHMTEASPTDNTSGQGDEKNSNLLPVAAHVATSAATTLTAMTRVADSWSSFVAFVQSASKFVRRANEAFSPLGLDMRVDIEPITSRSALRHEALQHVITILQGVPSLERDHHTTGYDESLREWVGWSATGDKTEAPYLHILVSAASSAQALQRSCAWVWAQSEAEQHEGLQEFLALRLDVGKSLVEKFLGRIASILGDALAEVRRCGFRDVLQLQSAGVIREESANMSVASLADLFLKPHVLERPEVINELQRLRNNQLHPPTKTEEIQIPYRSATVMARRCLHVAPPGLTAILVGIGGQSRMRLSSAYSQLGLIMPSQAIRKLWVGTLGPHREIVFRRGRAEE